MEASSSTIRRSPEVLFRARNLSWLQAPVDEVRRHLGDLLVRFQELLLVARLAEVHQLALRPSSSTTEALCLIWFSALLHVGASGAILVCIPQSLVPVPGQGCLGRVDRSFHLLLAVHVAIFAG